MKISKEFLEDMIDSNECLEDTIVGHRRWSVTHSMVFPYEGKLYQTTYEVPATESQDNDPFGYQTEVECVEVKAVEKTVTVYEAI